MAKVKALVRQWTLLKTLCVRPSGTTYEDLARETGVAERTIQRDLPFLASLGFPLKETLGEHGRKRWRVDGELGLAQLRFTLEEAAALHLGRQFLEPLVGTLFHSGARSAHQKIRATLGEAALRHLEKLAANFYQTRQGWTDYGDKAKLIDDLSLAIEDRRLTVITYQSLRSTEPVTLYDVLPYAIVFHKAALYLIAYSNDHEQIRTFKVDRISDVVIHDLRFNAPTDFCPESFLDSSFGVFEAHGEPVDVRVLFRAKVARVLDEKRFHSSQKLFPQRDGSVIAEFRLASFEEFTSWILSFGPEAQVLFPEDLRQTIIRSLQSTIERYMKPIEEASPPRSAPSDGSAASESLDIGSRNQNTKNSSAGKTVAENRHSPRQRPR